MDFENMAIAHHLSNVLNDVVKNCKTTLEEQVSNITSLTKAFEINLENINEIPKNEKILKAYSNDNFIGYFMQFNNYFFHIKSISKNIIEEKDKIEYEIMKKGFEVKNFNNLSISATTMKKLETKAKKNDDIQKFNTAINEIIENKECKEEKTYRLSLKESDILTTKNIDEILSHLTNESNKNKISFFGAKLYNLLGANIEQEQELRVSISQKDKLLNFLTNDKKLKDKDELKNNIENMNFSEKMELLNTANIFQQICENFVKSKNNLKEDSIYYTQSISYLINKNELIKKIDENLLQKLLKNECDFISLKCEKSFEYNKTIVEKAYFVKNIAFNDLNSKDFQEYILKEKENKKMLDSIDVNLPKKGNYYNKNISLKPK